MSDKCDVREKSGSSQAQQSSENECESKNRDHKLKLGKECDTEAKINRLLGYCPQKLSKKPVDIGVRGNRVESKPSYVKRTARDCTAKKVEKKSLQCETLSCNQLTEKSVQKSGSCQLQQINNNSEKIESDENANALAQSSSTKSEFSKDNITDFTETKDASSSSKRCQENLSHIQEDKKNRKGRIVSSRYMQAAKQANRPSAQAVCSASNNGSGRKMGVNDKKTSERANLNSTPAVVNHNGLPLLNNRNTQITSTPAFHALPLCHDMSSIMADSSMPNFGLKALLAPSEINNRIKSNFHAPETAGQKLALPSDSSSGKVPFFSQTELTYCRFLQAIFLEAKSADVLKKKFENAKEQLYSLWEENQALLELEAKLDSEISAFENLQHINSHLDCQEKYLEPVNDAIEKLDNEYKNIAKALDTTRHQLPTSGIFLCDMNDLSDTLKETEKVSELLTTTVKPNEESLITLASSLSKIEDTVQVQMKELHRCLELTKNTESLTAQESSLQIQSIQKNIDVN